MKKISNAIDIYDNVMGTIGLLAMVIIVFWQVLSRYVLGSSLRWSEEVARYLMLYISFLGVGAGIKRHKHMGIDLFDNLLPPKGLKILKIVAAVVTLLIMAVFVYFSGTVTLRIFRSGQVSPAAGVPMFLAYGTIPLGFFVGVIRQIEQIRILIQTPAVADEH